MRQQNIWLRILCLVALIPVVVPVSAQAALCGSRQGVMPCCQKVQPKVETPKSSCCEASMPTSTQDQMSEAGDKCQCVLKSLPSQNPNDSQTLQTASSGIQIEHVATLVSSISVATVEGRHVLPSLFYGDSSPPLEPNLSHHLGRAPPCF